MAESKTLTLEGVLAEVESKRASDAVRAAVTEDAHSRFVELATTAFQTAIIPAVEKLRQGLQAEGLEVKMSLSGKTLTGGPESYPNARVEIALPAPNMLPLRVNFWCGPGQNGRLVLRINTTKSIASQQRDVSRDLEPASLAEHDVTQALLEQLRSAMLGVP